MSDKLDDIDPIEAYRQSLEKKSDNTESIRERTLDRFTDWYEGELSSITWLDVENFVTYLFDQGYASRTVQSHYDGLSQFCQFLTEKMGVLDENPVEKADPLKDWDEYSTETKKSQALGADEDIPSITPDEKEQLCDNAARPIRDELILRLLWQTGVRAHELRKIELDHVDRENRRIEIYGDKDEDHDRVVGYQPNLDVLFSQWIDGGYRDSFSSAADSEYLFLTHKSGQMGQGSVNKMVKRAAEEAGIQEEMYEDAAGRTRWKITAHTLRHSFALQSLNNGMDIHYVKELLGHGDVEITDDTYLNSGPEDNLEALRKHGAGTESAE